MNRDKFLRISVVWTTGMLTLISGGAAFSQNQGSDQESANVNNTAVEEIIATGTRLRNVAPTGHVEVLTSEEIAKLGLSTAEEIVRSLPQNYSTVTSASTAGAGQGGPGTPSRSLGTASVGLRGLGSDATLVLVNGRRVASSPIFDGNGAVNLNGIPVSAIERVEVLFDGASAIYGSDALGGVINFILKKNWTGAETSVRYLNGANGGDEQSISQTLGTSWTSGSVTFGIDHKRSDSVDAAKAGSISSDYTAFGGPDLGVDNPFRASGPNGNIVSANTFGQLGSLPQGTTGNAWTAADLSPANVPIFNRLARAGAGTADSEETGVTLSLSQKLSERITGFLDVLYSQRDNEAFNAGSNFVFQFVPASNPFNQTGEDVFVGYQPPADSPLAQFRQFSDQTDMNISVGADFEIANDWLVSTVGTFGESETVSKTIMANQFGSAFNDALFGIGPALNFFTGEHDPGLDLTSLVGPDVIDGQDNQVTKAETNSFEISANGSLFSIAGGDVAAVAGAQLRTENIDYGSDPFAQLVNRIPDGQAKLERDVVALFLEGSVPLVGESNQVTGIKQLLLTVAGRWEDYEMTYIFDGEGTAPRKISFDNFSPRLGLKWQIVDGFSVRASWSEGFRAPGLLELGQPFRLLSPSIPINDPDAPGATPGNPVTVFVPLGRGGNPQLEPETADTISIGFEWKPPSVQGLTVKVNYTDLDHKDKIETVDFEDARVLGRSLQYPDIYERDENGNLVSVLSAPSNVAESRMNVWDFDVDYLFSSNVGDFDVGLAATYTSKAEEAIVAGDEFFTRVGTDLGPDRFVARIRGGWSRDNYGGNLIVNHSGQYYNTNNFSVLPALQKVDSYTTVDLTVFLNTNNGWKFKGGIRNLADESFPVFFSESSSYDPTRVDPRGRVTYVEVAKYFDF